jgi:hypothetical protein
MLGRKDYTKEELDNATRAVTKQIAAYRKLVRAVEATGDKKAEAALAGLEPILFNNMVLTLDRYFVHRLRIVTGKDTNPLNELELLTESLMNNGGVLRGNNVIKYVPEDAVLNVEPGAKISLSAADFEQLAKGVLAEIDAKFA